MFHIHHSNRCERLLDTLAKLCSATSADPFIPETIVVQNPGMARWLALGLAERNGVAAHLDFPLLASFIWRIYASQLDRVPEQSPMGREILVWRLMALLPGQLDEPAYAELRHYLRESSESQRRYQFAQRMADLFDQYLVFRADRMLAWEQGEEDHWQARLWRTLCGGGQPRHRARLYAEFADLVRAGALKPDVFPDRVALFGLSAIPPSYIDVLRALAEITDVHLFLLNPSLDYWGDIVDARTRARLKHQRVLHGRPGEADYLHVGNPLLASLGAQARDFFDLLHEGEGSHEEDYVKPERLDMLGQIQLDILLLQSRGVNEESQSPVGYAAEDPSIQVHVTHSRMREVQVLHDRLLALFEDLPGLTTRDIVVMAPEIDIYAPYIEAVFGAAPPDRRIPWSIADRRMASELPIAPTLMTLLGLPHSRFALSEVLALLEDTAILRRLGMDEAGLERVRQWVRETNIRWGLDADMRAGLGLPAEEMTTWTFGLRRLLMGYAMPAESERLVGGVVPYADVEGSGAADLGLLADFVDRLGVWHGRLAQPRTASEWVETINQLLEDFFIPDEGEAYFLNQVRETLTRLQTDSLSADFREPIELTVVRDFLRDQWACVHSGQAFLDGRVSFCNMVPMRSIPFRVVCLLGMNDGEYPRVQRPLGFDLMAQYPRPGDRSRREDDRYLFLEALLSARDVFYVSYIGRDIRTNSARVPSVLVSELLETVNRSFYGQGDESSAPDILTEHPLQPFSPRNFEDERMLFSYAREWLANPEQTRLGPFCPGDLPEPEPPRHELELDELDAFLENPARYLLERRLGIFLREVDESIEDAEHFALDRLEVWQLKNRALQQILEGRREEDLRHRVLAEGSLPCAGFGELALASVMEPIPQFAGKLREQGLDAPRENVEADLDIGGCRLRGWLREVGTNGLLLYRIGKLRARDRLHLWLHHLVLNALAPLNVMPVSTLITEDATLCLGPVSDAVTQLQILIDLYQDGWRRPQPLFAESSLVYAGQRLRKEQDASVALNAAMRVWNGNSYVSGEADNPYYRLAFRDQHPLDELFETLALRVFQPLFAAEQVGGC